MRKRIFAFTYFLLDKVSYNLGNCVSFMKITSVILKILWNLKRVFYAVRLYGKFVLLIILA